MMTLKDNLKLRKVGNRYMLVDVSDHDMNITAVHTFNETAAFVWNVAMETGVEPAALASMLCREYDVTYEVALSDVNGLLHIWQESGLIV